MRDAFLDGMSQAACTVSIVTTDGPAGRAGVTVSAMCSVSADTPGPSLLVCVHHLSPACAAIRDNGAFCVNVLRDDQSAISDTFAGRIKRADGDKFGCADWTAGATGAPVLGDPLVAFDCRLKKHFQWGTHYIFVGELADIVVNDSGSPLIYANRAYGTPAPLPLAAAQAPRAANDASASLRIGCFVTLGPYFVPRLTAGLLADWPEADVGIVEGTQTQLVDGLRGGAFDSALTYDLELDDDIAVEVLGETTPHVLLPQAHPLAARSEITLAELAPEPMVLLDIPPSRNYFSSLFRDAGLQANIRFHSPSFEMVRGMVGYGLGYAILVTKPANSMTYDGRALVVRRLADEVRPGRIVVARRTDHAPTPLTDAFADHCRSVFVTRH